MSLEKNENRYKEIFVAELPSDMISSWNGISDKSRSTLHFSTEFHLNNLLIDARGEHSFTSTPIFPNKTHNENLFCTSYSRLSMKNSLESNTYMEAYIMNHSSEFNNSSPNVMPRLEEMNVDDSLHQLRPTENIDEECSILIKQNINHNSIDSRMKHSMPLKFSASCAELFELGLKEQNKLIGERDVLLFVADGLKVRAYSILSKGDNDTVKSIETTTELKLVSAVSDSITSSSDPSESSLPNHGDNFMNPFTRNLDTAIGNPWIFSSPITFLKTCVLQICDEDLMNFLAVSCEDGSVRMISFDTRKLEESAHEWKICLKGNIISEFVVDGPITSLSFVIDHEKKSHDVILLLVGSIWGFGCLFEFDIVQKKFLGPFSIAGGFWNNVYNEEDAITALHYFKESENKREIWIGLFSGRLILLSQTYPYNDHTASGIQQRELFLRSHFMFHEILPYPVFAIQSMIPKNGLVCDIIVITRRTVHIFRPHIDKIVQDIREKVDILVHKYNN